MVDKEKLLKAMECFISYEGDKIPETRDECRQIGCPYAGATDCEEEIIRDCYDLLKSNKCDISNTINVMRKTALTMLEIIEWECNRNEGESNE